MNGYTDHGLPDSFFTFTGMAWIYSLYSTENQDRSPDPHDLSKPFFFAVAFRHGNNNNLS